MALWRVISCESLASSSRKKLFDCTHTREFFTLSHIQSLHDSHLNTGYQIAELQANLVWNKANTWLNKFNLTCLTVFDCDVLNKKDTVVSVDLFEACERNLQDFSISQKIGVIPQIHSASHGFSPTKPRTRAIWVRKDLLR